MSNDLNDQELLRRFAANGAEDAFRALAERFTGLVFGTAFRILRERTGAEEVTQNVLVALARKAAFLPADTCVGAWLHRSAVLEAKNWVRREMRRKQREEQAGGTMMEREESLLQTLATVLDEALLDLKEQDRAALLLRYIQQRNLKEVGQSLGVNEDTAQKRVAKALDLLTRAFRKRGYAVPGVALMVSVLEGAAHAAPAGLVASATTAALSAAAPAASLSGLTFLAAKFMALTKTQTATLCVLLSTAPVAFHWQLTHEAKAEVAELKRMFETNATALADLESRHGEIDRELMLGQNAILAQAGELRRLATVPKPELPPEEQLYRWSEDSDYVRLPKGVLGTLRLTPAKERILRNGEVQVARGEVLDEQGYLSPILLEALGLDANQAANVQSAFLNFAQDFHALAQANTVLTNSMPPGVGMGGRDNSELVTLRTMAFPEEGGELRSRLWERLESLIGSERAEILLEKQAAADFRGNYLDFGKYDKWVAVARQRDGLYTVVRSKSKEGTSYGASMVTIPYEGVPEELKPYIEGGKTE